MKILLLEDNKVLASSVKDALEKRSFSVTTALWDKEGETSALSGLYDMVILDEATMNNNRCLISDICRKHNGTSVIVIGTGHSVEDRISGLDSGADYYISAPFDMRELCACINAITRRNCSGNYELSFGNTRLEVNSCQLVCGEERVRLSAKEFDVMRILLYANNSVVPKETILSNVWGRNSVATDNHVEVYVGFLRRKLDTIGSNVAIKSVRRMGYFLEVE